MKLSPFLVICLSLTLLHVVTAGGKASKKGGGKASRKMDDDMMDDAPVLDVDDEFMVDDPPIAMIDDAPVVVYYDDDDYEVPTRIQQIARPFLGAFNNAVEVLAGMGHNVEEPGDFVEQLVEVACDGTLDFLGLTNVECNCTGTAETTGNALADASCMSEYTCLAEYMDIFCGTSETAVLVGAGSNGMYAALASCLELDMGVMEEPFSLMDNYELCFAAESSDGLSIDTCSATIKGESCTCEVCPSPAPAFKLDCSMIELSPSPDFSFMGPKLDVCTLLDFTAKV